MYTHTHTRTYTLGRESLSQYNDLLQFGRSGDRIPVGAMLSAPLHTYFGTHPAPYKISIEEFSEGKVVGVWR